MIQAHYWQAITEGKLTFGWSVGLFVLIVGVLVLLALAILSYRRTTRPLTPGWRIALTSLRACSFLLLGFLLLDPGVLVSEVNPQETYIAVLVDDSQSMSIRDKANLPSRHEQVMELLYGWENVLARLGETFQVRAYRFSDIAQRMVGSQDLTLHGSRTSLGQALEQVSNELSAFPLAAVVVISDGADNSEHDPLQFLEKRGDEQPPVFTVGIGATSIDRDISIASVMVDRAQLQDSVYQVHVDLRQRGYHGQTARISIAGDRGVVAEQRVELPGDDKVQRYTLELKPQEQDILLYQLSVEEKAGETIRENNRHTFFVDNRPRDPLNILYVEGQPRNEYKFIRRAVHGDRSLRLATYLQTGPRKFLRQGITSPEELSRGFPRTEEELFHYSAVVLGQVDRSLLNDQQLELLQEFVARRGGGLLQLGRPDESLLDSVLRDILPVELLRESQLPSYLQGGARRGDHPAGMEFTPRLTREGEYSPLLRLESLTSRNRERWSKLPSLQGVHVTGPPKLGATVLLEHPDLRLQNSALPVLTLQRYGAGRSMLLATSSSWRWQMMMPHDDDSHQRLWRQQLRWLAEAAPKRLSLNLDRDQYTVGETVSVRAQLLNKAFQPDNQGLLWLQIKSPDGAVTEEAMSWEMEKDGSYRHSFIIEQEGIYDLTVRVPSEVDNELQAKSPLLVAPSRREFVRPAMDDALLKRLANNSGGRFYTADNVHQLVDDITFAPNPYSKLQVHSLWDQPLFLILLLVLLSVEWVLRRMKGLS